jgi:hypothetical protein
MKFKAGLFIQLAIIDCVNLGVKSIFFFFFSSNCTTAASGPGPPRYRGFTIALRHTTVGRNPLDE